MYVEVVPNRSSPPAILLREGWREGSKVRKRTLANLSSWPPAKIDALRKLLKNQPLVSPDQAFSIVCSRPHGHVELVLEACRRLALPKLLDRSASPQRSAVLAMIAQRLLHPASKLATTRLWHATTLAQELDLQDADEEDLYQAMDWLLQRQDRIEQRLAKRHLQDDAQVLYDVSSSYYEGHSCPLMRYGYSRDGKRGRPIVVYGVLADRQGRPLAVRAYPGNTADPTTVPDQVQALRQRFGLQRLVLVGDRGMLTDTQIQTLRDYPGLGWISALRHHDIRRLAEQGSVQMSLFDERNLAEIHSPLYPDERLIVCCNPALAERRRHKREALLEAAEQDLARIQREVARRTKKPLLEAAIAEKVGRAKQRSKVAKHFQTEIADGRLEFCRDAHSIEREAALDGLYVIRASQSDLSAADVVRSYKQLTRVESAFRCLKTVDLQVRPIRHRSEQRVRAHLLLCLLAYYVEWHLRQALAELLFEDEDLAGWQARRDPVAAAQPRKEVQAKKNRRETAEGLELHSFSTLLQVLGTRCRHQCRLQGDATGPTVERLTEPSALQERALELVRTFPVQDNSKSS
jgi:transposase